MNHITRNTVQLLLCSYSLLTGSLEEFIFLPNTKNKRGEENVKKAF